MTIEQCKAMTKDEKDCNLRCARGKVYCTGHLKQCKDLIKKYHEPCDKVWAWYVECKPGMSLEQIDEIIEDLKKCYRLRCEYAQTCCNSYADLGHLGAMRQIRKKLEKCLDLKAQPL